MGTLEGLVAQVQALSGDADLPALLTALKAGASDSVMRSNAAGLLAAVAALDPAAHSLGCLYFLEAKARTAAGQAGDVQFVEAACRFLPACTPSQIRLAPAKFAALCRALKTHCVALGQPKRGVVPLRAAVAKLCPSTDLLSPVHSDLFQLCLLSKCYSGAGEALDADVFSVDPAKTGAVPSDVLLYCYYGALLEIGRRRYGRALELLLSALSAPTLVLSAITVACLKKWMLLHLLDRGSVPQLPKHTAPLVTRAIKTECGPYAELARLCGQGQSAAQLATFAQGKAAEFEADGNTGLVRLAIEGAARRQVQKLTQTYLTLSLTDIASQADLAGPAEAEVAVLRMVDAGEVAARISERDGMVVFLEEEESFSTEAMTRQLDGLISRAVELSAKVAAFDVAVSADRAYITKTELRGQRSKESAGLAPPAAASLPAEHGML